MNAPTHADTLNVAPAECTEPETPTAPQGSGPRIAGRSKPSRARPLEWMWRGRAAHGISLTELAQHLCIRLDILDEIERGTRTARVDQIEAAAALLGVNLDAAVDGPQDDGAGDGAMTLTTAFTRWRAPAANDVDGAAPRPPRADKLIIGIRERLIAARKINEWDQTLAACRLGYANSTQLSLLESGSRPVTFEHVVRAAKAYRVSGEWLLGLSQSHDGSAYRERRDSRIEDTIRLAASAFGEAIDRHERLMGGPTASTMREVALRGQAVLDALARLDAESFAEVRGGATLQRVAEEFSTVLIRAKRAIALHEAAATQMQQAIKVTALDDEPE